MIDELKAVLGRAWSLYCGHFLALHTLALTIWVPCIFFDAWFSAAKPLGHDFATFPFNRPASNVVGVLATCALLVYLREVEAARAVDPAKALKASLRYWGAMFFTQIIADLILALGCLLLVVPGIYLFVRMAAVQAVVVAEESDVTPAFQRSFVLTKGHFWAVLLWLAAGMIPVVVIGGALAFGLALILPHGDWIAGGVIGSAAALPVVFLFPLTWVIYVRLERAEVR